MGEALLSHGSFSIADIGHDPELQQRLFALQNGQTRELIVGGLRGWWVRCGGEGEDARMSPSTRTLAGLKNSNADRRDIAMQVEEPSDAMQEDVFFRTLPPYVDASASERAEAGRRLLALSAMGWRSNSRWYADRDELYER